MEKKLDDNYTRMLRAILNKSWKQHPIKHQLYGHLPLIMKTIKARWTRYAGHCWRSRDELISDVLLWTSSHGRAKAGRPARTYIQQLCEDMGCSPGDLPEAMNNKEKWQERIWDICAGSTTWWWWFCNTFLDLFERAITKWHSPSSSTLRFRSLLRNFWDQHCTIRNVSISQSFVNITNCYNSSRIVLSLAQFKWHCD